MYQPIKRAPNNARTISLGELRRMASDLDRHEHMLSGGVPMPTAVVGIASGAKEITACWGKISSGTNPYAWSEVYDNGSGVFTAFTSEGFSGTTTSGEAYEVNGANNVPADAIVRMYQYRGNETAGWLFSYSPSTSGSVTFGGPVTFNDTVTFNGPIIVADYFRKSSNAPAQLTANQNNYAPGDFMQLFLTSDATRTITGISGGAAGRLLFLYNAGSFPIILSNENASSTAANRITTPWGGDCTMLPSTGVILEYRDETTDRWLFDAPWNPAYPILHYESKTLASGTVTDWDAGHYGYVRVDGPSAPNTIESIVPRPNTVSGTNTSCALTLIRNVDTGAGATLILKDESAAAGTASHRIQIPHAGDLQLASEESALLGYDTVNSRHFVVGYASPLTIKGDILGHSGTVHGRLAVGANDTILVADSAQTLGFKWLAGSGTGPPVGTSRTLTAGAGLTGGGTLAADRTFDVGAGTGITVNANDVALTVPVTAILGGTAQTTWTTGDIMYASAANTLAKLGIGSSGQVLTVAAGIPSWAAAAAGSVACTLLYSNTSVGSTITNTTTATDFTPTYTLPANTLAAGDVLLFRFSGVYDTITTPTGNMTLRADSGDVISTGPVTMTDVNGDSNWVCEIRVLAWVVGGSGTLEKSGYVHWEKVTSTADTWMFLNGGGTLSKATNADIVFALRFQWGTANVGNAITLREFIVEHIKTASGGAASNALLDGSAHTDTVAQTVSRGSLVYGNSTPKWDELVIGAANRVLRSDGTDASWAQVALATDVSGTLPVANGGTGRTAYSFCSVFHSVAHSLTDATDTLLTFDSEDTDTDGWHSTVTNTERITPNVSGTFLCVGYIVFEALDADTRAILTLQKNGTTNLARTDLPVTSGYPAVVVADIVTLNGSTDYVNLRAYQDDATGDTKNTYVDADTKPRFKVWRLGA